MLVCVAHASSLQATIEVGGQVLVSHTAALVSMVPPPHDASVATPEALACQRNHSSLLMRRVPNARHAAAFCPALPLVALKAFWLIVTGLPARRTGEVHSSLPPPRGPLGGGADGSDSSSDSGGACLVWGAGWADSTAARPPVAVATEIRRRSR